MSVPERDSADSALRQAKAAATAQYSEQTAKAIMALAETVAHSADAIVHQIRDADDTVAMQLRPAIQEGLGDLTIATNGGST